MKVVVVESPAKAKTINKYLGDDYKVLASYGHVRDLPAKDGSVRPDEDFALSWEVDGKAERRLKDIQDALRNADSLFLATDPDREGEAISWHVQEILRQRKSLKGIEVRRVVFNEVTKSAVLEAFRNARDLNSELVEAYLARRALDYLVGFTLSPVLWRKLPGSRSAGRVQSVALRLVCEREAEIEAFRAREFWTVAADFTTAPGAGPAAGKTFSAELTRLGGKKLEKFDLENEAAARAAVARIEAEKSFSVARIERKQVRRNPQPPFTTSTLQQEASRKLGFGAMRTMQIAQRLYEGVDLGGETLGLITYMRTDGVQLSAEAVEAIRGHIGSAHGPRYVPQTARLYKTTAKNAQEAHEAVRPTDVVRTPESIARFLDPDQLRLYTLIWRRAVASQMESAVLDQVAIDVEGASRETVFRATGSVVQFDGFLALYQEGRDDADEEDEQQHRLPAVAEGAALDRGQIAPDQHFTQPPPRFTEASLVKRMEELGIGRPSTYASILQVLQDREYVRLDKKRFIPEDRGRLVTAFLSNFFERYVQYGFTANLETQLDDISGGRADWKQVLRAFWEQFNAAVGETKDLTITQVLTALDEDLGRHFFPSDPTGRDPRVCPVCGQGRLSLKLGKFGAFIGCSNYPECRFTRPLGIEAGQGDGATEAGLDTGPRVLGTDPQSGLPVTLRKGPYGTYVQLGEAVEGEKPKRASLPRNLKPADLTLEQALGLLSLPREVGLHPETREPILAGLGRFGPYLKLGKAYKSLSADDDVLNIGLNRAVVLLAEPSKGGRQAPTPIRILGTHPDDDAEIGVFKGRYGPYVSHNGVIASLPRDMPQEEATLEIMLPLLAAQAAKAKPAKGRTAKPAAKAKTGAKPAIRKKPAVKKAAAKPAAKPVPAEAEQTLPPPPKSTLRKAAPPAAVPAGEPVPQRAGSGRSRPE